MFVHLEGMHTQALFASPLNQKDGREEQPKADNWDLLRLSGPEFTMAKPWTLNSETWNLLQAMFWSEGKAFELGPCSKSKDFYTGLKKIQPFVVFVIFVVR